MARISGSETFRPNDLIGIADQIDETLPRTDLSYARSGELDGELSAAETELVLAEDALDAVAVNDYLRIEDEIVKVTAVTDQQNFTIDRAERDTDAAIHTDGTQVEKETETVVTISEVVLGAAMRGRPGGGNIVGVVVFEPEDDATDFTADLEISPDNENWETNESYDQDNLVDSLDVAANMYHRIVLLTHSAGKTVGVNFQI